jgi:flagellin
MALTIATNISSLNTQNWLSKSTAAQSDSLEKLSSGYKVNSASDDAAGYAIANKLNIKSASLSKAIDNGNQAVAMLQTASGALDTLSDILTRLKELATEAASDNNATDRTSLNTEAQDLEAEMANIIDGTKYGATALFSSTANLTFTFQLGDTNYSYNQISVTISSFSVNSTFSGDLTSLSNAQTYLTTVDTAITSINTMAAGLGAAQNKIDYHVQNMSVMLENTEASISTIKDADYASEMSDFTANQIKTQAGIAMLAQANQLPQQILSLIKS